MLSVTRVQLWQYDSPRESDIPFDYFLDSLSYRTIRIIQFSRFVKIRHNLDRAKLTRHWSAWRRHRNDSGYRATSLPYRLILAEAYLLLYAAKDELILLSDLFRVKYANSLSDFSQILQIPIRENEYSTWYQSRVIRWHSIQGNK